MLVLFMIGLHYNRQYNKMKNAILREEYSKVAVEIAKEGVQYVADVVVDTAENRIKEVAKDTKDGLINKFKDINNDEQEGK